MTGSAPGVDHRWFDEIDLDPDTPWLRMGTRQLGRRPWLVVDSGFARELALKATLVRDRHDEVFGVDPMSADAALAGGRETLELVLAERDRADVASGRAKVVEEDGRPHPLDLAGRSIQEDLCLMHRDDRGWVLIAASLCFPSRWRLADKLGRPLDAVHRPVGGYQDHLARRVDSLFDRLGDSVVWRRNWFVHPDPALFQPDRPVGGDPIVPGRRWRDGLFVRSERQTIRRLPESGQVLFTIKIDHAALGRFLADPARRAAFVRYLVDAAPSSAAHRGLAPDQVAELLAAFDR